MFAGGFLIVFLFARTDDHADFINSRVDCFIGDQLERRFCDALLVDKILQGERFLVGCASRNYGFQDTHRLYPSRK